MRSGCRDSWCKSDTFEGSARSDGQGPQARGRAPSCALAVREHYTGVSGRRRDEERDNTSTTPEGVGMCAQREVTQGEHTMTIFLTFVVPFLPLYMLAPRALGAAGGLSYEVIWQANERVGVATYGDGSKYEGEFDNCMRNGRGTYTSPTGERYTGEWENDTRHGHGVCVYTNGDTYEGDWVHDARTGRGTMKYASGDLYDGEWKDNLRHGKGTFVAADGQKYTGRSPSKTCASQFPRDAARIIKGVSAACQSESTNALLRLNNNLPLLPHVTARVFSPFIPLLSLGTRGYLHWPQSLPGFKCCFFSGTVTNRFFLALSFCAAPRQATGSRTTSAASVSSSRQMAISTRANSSTATELVSSQRWTLRAPMRPLSRRAQSDALLGQGKCTYANGDKYEGPWVNGAREGPCSRTIAFWRGGWYRSKRVDRAWPFLRYAPSFTTTTTNPTLPTGQSYPCVGTDVYVGFGTPCRAER